MPTLLTEPNQRFFEAFCRLRRSTSSLVPPRKSLTLSVARRFAAHLAIIEAREPMTAHVRLVGTAIVQRTGIDNTGKNWLDLFSPEAREFVWQRIRRLCDTPLGVRALIREQHTYPVIIETLNLPFARDDGTPSFMISTAVPLDLGTLSDRGKFLTQDGGYMEEQFIELGAQSQNR